MDNATTSFTIILPAVSIRPTAGGLACSFQKLTSRDLLVLISKSVAAANALVKKEVKENEPAKFVETGVEVDKIETPVGDLVMKRRPKTFMVDDPATGKPGAYIKCNEKGEHIDAR